MCFEILSTSYGPIKFVNICILIEGLKFENVSMTNKNVVKLTIDFFQSKIPFKMKCYLFYLECYPNRRRLSQNQSHHAYVIPRDTRIRWCDRKGIMAPSFKMRNWHKYLLGNRARPCSFAIPVFCWKSKHNSSLFLICLLDTIY